jgi:trans-aconitate 2-methyltransferase
MVLNMYNWDPADYDKSSSAQYKWAMTLIDGLDLKGDECILDIGCGDGKVTAHLASLVPDGGVLGIDLSREMISFAANKYIPKNHPNLSFQIGDASCLRFQEEFDQVVSFACLHWVKDHLPVLQGVRRSLKPGGRMLFQFGGRGNAARILDLTNDLVKNSRWTEYFRGFGFPYNFYGPEEYSIWLALAGLVPRRLELVPKDMVHKDRPGLEGIIRTTWLPYTERLPDSLRQEFVSEVASRYLEIYPLDEDGLVHVQMMRLEVVAEKPNL